MQSKRALVTGSSGFIGRHLVDALNNHHINVLPFSRHDGKNITNPKDFENLEAVDYIFHLAADTQHLENTIIDGTHNVLDYAKIYRTPIVYFSSGSVLTPHTPYARYKRTAETLCEKYSTDYDISIIILRCFNVYGQGQQQPFIVPTMIHELFLSNTITLTDPDMQRDMIHVSDVIHACIAAYMRHNSGYTIYNVGSGKNYSMRQLAQKLLYIHNDPNTKLMLLPTPPLHAIRKTLADISKTTRGLHWKPTISIDTGLRNTYNYYKSQSK